jgi:hypothetical protein
LCFDKEIAVAPVYDVFNGSGVTSMAGMRTLRAGRTTVPLTFFQARAARTIAQSIVGFVRAVVLFGMSGGHP